jgi:hypothetical protein
MHYSGITTLAPLFHAFLASVNGQWGSAVPPRHRRKYLLHSDGVCARACVRMAEYGNTMYYNGQHMWPKFTVGL